MSSLGAGSFSGFSQLSKGLAAVLVAGSIIVQAFPPVVPYVTLIPARTIPFAWNLVTAGYVEQSFVGLIVSTLGLLFIGRLVEPIWGSKEFVKFIFLVNFLTSICIFVTAIAFYYFTRQESYLYTPLSGFQGVLLGFLVGIKQILPDQELSSIPQFKIKTKWMPSIILLLAIAISFFYAEAASYLPTIIFGTYMSWIYLRYFQSRETNLRGDPSDDFAFSTFFPSFLRPVIDPVASVFDRMFCGRPRVSDESQESTLGGAPLLGSDPTEASRRRQRGERALEERLASEKILSGVNKEELSHKDPAENV